MTLRNFLALALLAPVMAAQALTFGVTRNDDPTPGPCEPTDCSLREAVIAANQTVAPDTVTIPSGTYFIVLTGSDSGETVGDLDVTEALTIRGQGNVVIDGQMQGRILDVRSGQDFLLENVTLRNADTSIDTNGTLNGGGMQIDDGNNVLRNVTFSANSAQSLGGAVYVTGDASVAIEDCDFIDNTAGTGAGFFTSSTGDITISDTVFDGNRTDSSTGGAIQIFNSQVDTVLERVTLQGNESMASGAGIQFGGASLTLIDSVIVDNIAVSNGSGLHVPGSGHAKQIDIRRTTFQGNRARSGGGLSIAGNFDDVTIENSSFIANESTDTGAGLHLTGGAIVLRNSTVSGNDAMMSGGGVLVIGAEFLLEHVTLVDNTAANASAIQVSGSAATSSMTIANSILEGECSAGADTVASLGGNLEGPGDTCQLDQASDLVDRTVSQLGVSNLADNGGPTRTHTLTAGSQARDHGIVALCADIHIDQRLGIRDSSCDTGAVEANAIANDWIFGNGFQ